MASYGSAKLVQTLGGADAQHDDDYLMVQSQHLAVDNDTVYVSMLLNRNIRAVNLADGTFKKDIGELGAFDGEFDLAAGVGLYGDEQIVVADNGGNTVQFFKKSDGSFLRKIDGSFDSPNCVAADNSKIYVGQVGDSSKKVLGFDSDLKELCAITAAGDKSLTGVNYLTYDGVNNKLIVSDTDGGFVHVFSHDCKYLHSIGEAGSGDGQFDKPAGVSVDAAGNILVCDMINSRVQVFDTDGKFLSVLGSDSDAFMSPLDVFVHNSSVYVVDGNPFSGFSRVQVFQI